MKLYSTRSFLRSGPCLLCGLATLSPAIASAQWLFPPSNPDAQRNALGEVRSQVNWLKNATSTAASYGERGYDSIWERFRSVRDAYATLKQTLIPPQLAKGANALAELDAGLDIIQESFGNYQADVSAGRAVNLALRDLCEVLRDASRLWLQEFNKICSQLRIGWG